MPEPRAADAAPRALPAPARGLLAVFPHPDDESYGAGGLMALAAAAGNPVWVLCLTNGDQGGRPGETDVDHSMDPQIRMDELRCACRAMGISEPVFLGYRDSGMEGWGAPEGSLARADEDEVVGRIVEAIERLRPAVVVTFDPGGVYGHPDHVTCSARASEAYRRAASRPGGPVALYHQAMSRSGVAAMQEAMAMEQELSGEAEAAPTEDDLRQQEAFVRLARPDDEITTRVAIGPVLDRKLAALDCHQSQMSGRRWDDPEARPMVEKLMGHETYVRVDPPPKPGEQEALPLGLDWGDR